jgi:hypothetical protein
VLSAATVSAGSITKTSATVTFASVSNASGYTASLYSSTGSLLLTIPSFTSGTAIGSLSPDTSYSVSVTAIGDVTNYTNSGESNRASFTTVAIPVLASATLTLVSTAPHSAVVSFSNVTGSSSYIVSVYAADGVTNLRTIVNATSPLTISSLNANSRYKVSIFSVGDYTNYLSSAESAKLTIDTPPLPQVGAASPSVAAVTGTSAVLTFTNVPNAVGYTVKVRNANGSTLLQTVNNYLAGTPITGLSGSTTYQMELIARGDGASYGDATANTPITVTTAAVSAALGTPTTVAAAGTTQTSTTVTFTAVAHATSYTLKVYQSGVVVQTLANFTSGSSVTGLSASTSYQVGVTAIGDVANYSDSSESAQASLTTPAWPQLSSPALTVSSSQPTSASVSWSGLAGAASYTVKVYAANGSTLLQTITSAVSPLTVTGLTASTGYNVSILAVADGTHTSSAESVQSSVTTASATPAPSAPVTVPSVPSVDPAPAVSSSVSVSTADVTVVGQQAKVNLSGYLTSGAKPKATLIGGESAVQDLTLEDGNLVLKLAPTFSGKVTVVVLADTVSQKLTVKIPVLVVPVPASKLEAAQSTSGIPTFNWQPSPNAQAYTLASGGVELCKTDAASCTLKAPLANGTKLTLTALGADQTFSEPVELEYKGPAKLSAGSLSLVAPSKRLLAGEKTLLASAISSATALKYGKVIVTVPAAVVGQALLKVRAVKAFLRQLGAQSAIQVLVRSGAGQKNVAVALSN